MGTNGPTIKREGFSFSLMAMLAPDKNKYVTEAIWILISAAESIRAKRFRTMPCFTGD